jgi:hypothetical protein
VIKQPILFALSGVALAVAVGLLAWRGLFYFTAVEAVGTVAEITASNGNCGSSKHRYACTHFTAQIAFPAQGTTFRTSTAAGERRGHGQPVSGADYRVGQTLPVVYSPLSPENACHDSVWDVWGMPILAFFTQLVMMFGSLFEGKKRRSSLW